MNRSIPVYNLTVQSTSDIAKAGIVEAWEAAKSFLQQKGGQWTDDPTQARQEIERLSSADLRKLRQLTLALVDELSGSPDLSPTAAGVDLRQLRADLVSVGDVEAAGDRTALRVEDSDIGEIRVAKIVTRPRN